ncbi:MAG: hypothetical protein R6U26_01575 [Candidatus Undinarchaeales archaeon]
MTEKTLEELEERRRKFKEGRLSHPLNLALVVSTLGLAVLSYFIGWSAVYALLGLSAFLIFLAYRESKMYAQNLEELKGEDEKK